MYWQLFKSNFIISAFTIGGGYVIIPLMKAKVVDEYHWLTDEEALNLAAIGQSAPGLVAVNTAIGIGYKIGGIKGALVGVLATALPPLITITTISYAYTAFCDNQYVQYILKGMQCGATAIIINVVLDLIKKQWQKKLLLPFVLIAVALAAHFFFHVNLMYLLLLNGLIGLIFMKDKKYN